MKSKSASLAFFAILAIGSILRFWFAAQYGPYELSPDGVKYAAIASNLVKKGVFSVDGVNPTAEVGPGFPLLLALSLIGTGTMTGAQRALLIFQALFGVTDLILVYLIGRIFYGRAVGLMAMALSAVYLPLVVIQHFTLTESLYTLLILLSVYLLSVWQPAQLGAKDFGRSLAIGCIIAGQTLVRAPSIIFIGVPLALAFYSGLRSGRWRGPVFASLLVLSTFSVTLAPWGIRNFRVMGEFIVTSVGSIDPLLAGVYSEDDKYLAARRELDNQLEKQRVATSAASLDFSKKYVLGLIARRFQDEPFEAAKWYLFGKFRRLWSLYDSGMPFAKNESAGFHKIIFVLALVSFAIQAFYCRRRGWFIIGVHIVVTSAVYQVFFATGRYSLPFVPLLMILAAEFLVKAGWAWGLIRDGRFVLRQALAGRAFESY